MAACGPSREGCKRKGGGLYGALPEGPPEGKCRSAASLSRPGPGPARARGRPAGLAKAVSRPYRSAAGVDITMLCRARIPPTPTLHNGAIMRCWGEVGPDLGDERFWRQRSPRPASLRAFPRARRPEASEGDRADWRNRSDPDRPGAGQRGSKDTRGARREADDTQASGERDGGRGRLGSPEQSGLQAPARRARPHRLDDFRRFPGSRRKS